MPNCLLEIEESLPPVILPGCPQERLGPDGGSPCPRPVPCPSVLPVLAGASLPLAAASPRGPAVCSQIWPQSTFPVVPVVRGLGGSFPAGRTMAILSDPWSGCVGVSEEVPGWGALRQQEEDGSCLPGSTR